MEKPSPSLWKMQPAEPACGTQPAAFLEERLQRILNRCGIKIGRNRLWAQGFEPVVCRQQVRAGESSI